MQPPTSKNWNIVIGVGRLHVTHTVPPLFTGQVFDLDEPPPPDEKAYALPNGRIMANVIWAGPPEPYDQLQELLQELAEVLDGYNAHTGTLPQAGKTKS